MENNQLGFNFMSEVAPNYPEPIPAICQLIDLKIQQGKKVDDLKDHLKHYMNRYMNKDGCELDPQVHESCMEYVDYGL